jgi:hypothetical protein
MINKVKDQLLKTYPQELVDSILDSYTQLAENFMRSKIRPSEVEGGRFCEATIRMLQYKTTGTYTPMGTSLNLDTEINVLRNLPATSFDDSIRLHIPRTIRVIYDIRSKRDSAHLGNINPNLMDGTLVLNCCKWILAELFRMESQISVDEAQQIINNLVEKEVPIIQNFGSFEVILNTQLTSRSRILVLLYNRGEKGATRAELSSRLPPKMRNQLGTQLSRLQHDKSFIHRDKNRIYITRSGEKFVEDNILPKVP